MADNMRLILIEMTEQEAKMRVNLDKHTAFASFTLLCREIDGPARCSSLNVGHKSFAASHDMNK